MNQAATSSISENENLKARLAELNKDRDSLQAVVDQDQAHLRESHDRIADALGEAAKKPAPSATATATSNGTATTTSTTKSDQSAQPATASVEVVPAPTNNTAPAQQGGPIAAPMSAPANGPAPVQSGSDRGSDPGARESSGDRAGQPERRHPRRRARCLRRRCRRGTLRRRGPASPRRPRARLRRSRLRRTACRWRRRRSPRRSRRRPRRRLPRSSRRSPRASRESRAAGGCRRTRACTAHRPEGEHWWCGRVELRPVRGKHPSGSGPESGDETVGSLVCGVAAEPDCAESAPTFLPRGESRLAWWSAPARPGAVSGPGREPRRRLGRTPTVLFKIAPTRQPSRLSKAVYSSP